MTDDDRPEPAAGGDDTAQHREALLALVADFRHHAAALVDALRAQSTGSVHDGEVWELYDDDGEWIPEVTALGRTWTVWLHEPHGDLEAADGTLVVAHLSRPDLLDAAFLHTFAVTSGRHPAMAAHPDLYALLEATVPGWDGEGTVV